jgi:hypothetical protein
MPELAPAALVVTPLHARLLVVHSYCSDVEAFEEVHEDLRLVDLHCLPFPRVTVPISWGSLSLLLKVNEAVGFVLIVLDVVGNHEQGLILVVLEGDHLHDHPAAAPAGLHALLLQVFHLLGEKVDVGDEMPLDITDRRRLYVLNPPHYQHPFPQLIKTLKVEDALSDGLHEVFPLEDVGCCGVLRDCLEIDRLVEDQRAEAEDVERWVSLLRLDVAREDSFLSAVDVVDAEDIDSAIVDDD